MCFKSKITPVKLMWTDDPNSVDTCLHFVVYLNARTHNGPLTEALHQELDTALSAGRHIILVHETRPALGGASFKSIIDATPKWLAWNQVTGTKRLYQELAVPVCGGPHFPVSAHLLLGALAQGSGRGSRSLLGRSELVIVQRKLGQKPGIASSAAAPASEPYHYKRPELATELTVNSPSASNSSSD